MIKRVFSSVGRIIIVVWTALLVTALVSFGLERFSLAFVSLATLLLSFAPILLARRFSLRLPMPFVFACTVFLIASLVLGEAFDFYNRFWWWDLALHTSAAVGFGLVGYLFVLMLFEGDRFAAPPSALALIAFCVAMTLGVLWEVFEFAADIAFGLNMQKSGLNDTMGDLIVNALGAFVASLAGYFYSRFEHAGIFGKAIDQFVQLNRSYFRKAIKRLRR